MPFSEFPEGFFLQTAGVNLTDFRKFLCSDPTDRDTDRNHSVIPGDVFAPSTHESVKHWLNGKQVDLIIERFFGPLKKAVPHEAYFVGKELKRWYTLLAEKGMIFAQVPNSFWPLLEYWKKMVDTTHKGAIEIRIGHGDQVGKALYLRKIRADVELPLLHPRIMRLFQE